MWHTFLLSAGCQMVRTASQGYEIYCHDLEIMGWNPSQAELAVHSSSVLNQKGQEYNKVKSKISWS